MIRFYLDEHVPGAVAKALRERGIECTGVQEVGLGGISDSEQLRFAMQEKRVLVTFDSDFLRLASSGFQHHGIVYCTRDSRNVREIVRGLVLISEILTEGEMNNSVEFL